jgi:hypothetical protein
MLIEELIRPLASTTTARSFSASNATALEKPEVFPPWGISLDITPTGEKY